ncbi:S9 family peptidase [Pseudoxanthomonas helianthi]|uniref:S9 family peptidase n=1 Tax=Pseudoxanthomonas helianthi TaxID=1453541 RepID=A0A940X320_9GAMM|nr:alpha/beta fold hydrolase [Pseudoxanthomonas helianthi]MBP3983725.1 S9 family peptidase [Pseudoxanthomonas helianthi]
MSHRIRLSLLALALVATPALAQTGEAASSGVKREVVGNRTSENIPAIPAELIERLNRYQNTRGAAVAGWTKDGCLLVSTRFAETAQAHRVCQPLGMREQLTFYPEPVAGLATAPARAARSGFVFSKDKGGDEFSQLYWFDDASREISLLTDGKRNQNNGALFSPDGARMAYSSTARNGTDTDIWVRDVASGTAKPVVTEGGSWSAQDFSPDGKQLLVVKYVSAAESYPGVVDLETGKLRMFPVDGGKAAFGGFEFAPDGRAVYFVSDEPLDGKAQEFQTLRYHDPATGKLEVLSRQIPWDVDGFTVADDGRHLAYVTNEDGISKLHVLALPSHKEVKLPELPVGVFGAGTFSPDGKRLALSINSATSPSDAYVIDLDSAKLVRWTRSEVGGLDASKFVSPSLVRYPTFDEVDGKKRTIPAFYYKPANVPAGKKLPVVINIHGGPEGQSFPTFSPNAQFMANELGVAMLVPNVRGSSGYGKTYLSLDNAEKREDSVKDIGALLDWIAQQPELDASRVGVVGGSYGGYMTLATLMHYSDRVRAGIDLVGISDFATFLTNTESYRRDLRRAEYGDERTPEMQKVFAEISPARHADRIRSRLFVAQGKNDPRVPYTEAEQIVKAVRANGQPVWYLLYDDEGHGFRKKGNSDWFGAASILFWQQNLLN